MPATPETRASIDNGIDAAFTDPLNSQNTADNARKILKRMNQAAYNRSDDPISGGTGPGPGTSDTFTNDFTVALSNGKTFGRYANGQIVPAQGRTAPEVILLAAIEELFPNYTAPSASLSSSITAPQEVGTTFAPTLSPGFSQQDAGALTRYELKRGATSLALDTTAPIAYPALPDSYVLPLGTTTYTVSFNYAQGALKTGSQGSPAPGRISAGTVSASFAIAALFKSYFGYRNTNGVLTMAQVLALGSGQLQSGAARTVGSVTAGVGLYTVYAWPSTGSDNIATVLQDGVDSIRGAFGIVRYVTGPNAQGATVTMAYIISNATNAFTNSTLAFS